MSAASDDILFDRRGAAGIVTLNRPKALNAVTHQMVRTLAHKLREWASDGAVTRVVVTAAGGRAFSAGGDIRALYELGRAGRQEEALGFFREEYALNTFIKRYPKPYVALIDGIVMGGGVGISVHGSHRIAGERYAFGMPEVGIGFFPDVGATFALPNLPGELGAYCALTGDRLRTADGVQAGAATHHVRSDRFADLLDALCGNVSVDAVLSTFAEPPGEGSITARQDTLARLFEAARVEDIVGALEREAASGSADAEWAGSVAAIIASKSPTSLKIALAQLRQGKSLPFEECMKIEFRIVSRIVYGHDMYEGVRAVIIDKDNVPRWRPARLAEVSDQDVARYFAPLPSGELMLPAAMPL